MGGLFGVVSRKNCANDLFYGVDYHSHLGTTIAGLAVLSEKIVEPICHDITNSQFKTEFKDDVQQLSGKVGIGVISSRRNDRQPIVFKSKLGTFALCTDGLIKNSDMLIAKMIGDGVSFKESPNGFNQTELVGELICQGNNIAEGIASMLDTIHGTVSLLLLSEDEQCIYAVSGVFPLVVGKKTTANGIEYAIASETTAFPNLQYDIYSYPKYKDIISINECGSVSRRESHEPIVFCPFLHVYFDFPASKHYGVSGEIVRERCGGFLADNDDVELDAIMGVADSGIPHAHGYARKRIELAVNKSKKVLSSFEQGTMDIPDLKRTLLKNLKSIAPLRRPVIKFTPAWGRSYIPPQQSTRDRIAYYKQVSNPQMITNQSIALVDDSIRRGTQLRRFLRDKIWPYTPKTIHARIASPPQLFPCYFDETTSSSDLIARRVVEEIEEGTFQDLSEYQDVASPKYKRMVNIINETIEATSLKYISLSDMIEAIVRAPENTVLRKENFCTYCWTGKTPIPN
jgi:amidophosphoribosyltransferase